MLLLLVVVQIWSCLDRGHYLRSTALYLLSQHLYKSIQLDVHAANAVSRFPLLARHATSITHFRSTILQVYYSLNVYLSS